MQPVLISQSKETTEAFERGIQQMQRQLDWITRYLNELTPRLLAIEHAIQSRDAENQRER